MTVPPLLTNQYRLAQTRLLLLDYDGTLAKFKHRPGLAKPSVKVVSLLKRLGSDPKNTVVVISGRDQPTLAKWFDHLPLALVAEHGFAHKQLGSSWDSQFGHSTTWKTRVRTQMAASLSRVKGSFIEEKSVALVWHYRPVKDQKLALQEADQLIRRLQPTAKSQGLSILPGSKAVEVKPQAINKGAAATRFLSGKTWDFILAAGDDVTDEDLFAALPNQAFTIKIGAGATDARYRLADPAALIKTLELLVLE